MALPNGNVNLKNTVHPTKKAASNRIGVYGFVRLLSLDVAAGAVAAGTMVSGFLSQEMHWAWYLILPLAVWTIYTGDHLLDAYRLKDEASTPRHRFHYKHIRILSGIAVLGVLSCITLALIFLGNIGFYFGLGMGGLVLIHLALVKLVGERTSPFLIKEFGVALIYTLGIWGLPILKGNLAGEGIAMLPMVQFLLLALANLLTFSLFEYDLDEADGQTSFVRALGKPFSLSLIRLVLAAAVGIGAVVLTRYDDKAVMQMEMIIALMAAILSALVYKMKWFAQNERYRAWGDGAFLLPFLYLLFQLL